MEIDFDGGDSIEILKPFLNEDELSQNTGTPLAKGISNPSASTPAAEKMAPSSPAADAISPSVDETERKTA